MPFWIQTGYLHSHVVISYVLLCAQSSWSSLRGEGWKRAGGLRHGGRLLSWYAGAGSDAVLHLAVLTCALGARPLCLLSGYTSGFQVHKRLHLPSRGILPRKWLFPGSRTVLLPEEATSKPAQECFGQKLADAAALPGWGATKRYYCGFNVISAKLLKTLPWLCRHQKTWGICTWETWSLSTARGSSLNGRNRFVEQREQELKCYHGNNWALFLLQMKLKVIASEIFKDQKDGYPQTVGRLFLDTRLGTWWDRAQDSCASLQLLAKHETCPCRCQQNLSKSAWKCCRPSATTKCR